MVDVSVSHETPRREEVQPDIIPKLNYLQIITINQNPRAFTICILLKVIVINVERQTPVSNRGPLIYEASPVCVALALVVQRARRAEEEGVPARACVLLSSPALLCRRGGRAPRTRPLLSALHAMKFLSVLEQEKSGENLIPHLNTIIRKIVPETRASARSGITILLI